MVAAESIARVEERSTVQARQAPRPHPQRVEEELRELVRADEATHGLARRHPDTMWDHLTRTAALAERLGAAEGLDPQLCRLAGLFHDAGKFHGGRDHRGDVPEEQESVAVLRELAKRHRLATSQVEQVAEAILQLYQDHPAATPLARVLFDADNLDKLGFHGVASFFVKCGLRGRGVSSTVLHAFTAELTYARHAPGVMKTARGRRLARRRARETVRFLTSMLDQMREDGLADFTVEQVEFEGLTLDVVAPRRCPCNGSLSREIWQVPGITCTEIHVAHRCRVCGDSMEVRLCRPRLFR